LGGVALMAVSSALGWLGWLDMAKTPLGNQSSTYKYMIQKRINITKIYFIIFIGIRIQYKYIKVKARTVLNYLNLA
jgi:hypothetical protein